MALIMQEVAQDRYIDIPKPVNDIYGHATGDQLLIEVGKRLRSISTEATRSWNCLPR